MSQREPVHTQEALCWEFSDSEGNEQVCSHKLLLGAELLCSVLPESVSQNFTAQAILPAVENSKPPESWHIASYYNYQ